MAPRIKQRLQSMIDSRASEWLDRQVVRLGKDETQAIETGTPGILWARLANGKPIRIHVGAAPVPSRFDLRLIVGRKKSQPAIWQVVSILEDYDTPAGGGELTYHHKQHEENGGDRVGLSWKQIVARSVRVKDSAGFIVRVFGDPDHTVNGWVLIPTQDIDLSSYVPATGALFVAIESDDAGALSPHAGTGYGAPGVGTPAQYPVPDAGKYTRAIVLLYEGQTALLDEHISIPKPPSFNPGAFSSSTHNHDSRYPRKYPGKTTAPTVSDDSDDGYAVDDLWVDETNDRAYIALDVTPGAAVWQELGSGGGGSMVIDDLTSQIPATSDHYDLASDATGAVMLFYNATYQSPATFTLDVDNLGLTTSFSPASGDTLIAVYAVGAFTTIPVSDSDALHSSVSGEIDALPEKTTPVAGDKALIEDSEDSYAKKWVNFNKFGGGGWEQVLDEDGSSIANWTSGGGTWSSDGTVIKQTDTAQTWRTLKLNAIQDVGAGYILEAEVKVASYASGQYHIGGFVIGYDGTAATSGGAGASGELRLDNGTKYVVSAQAMWANRLMVAHNWGNVDEWHKLRIVSTGGFLSVYVDGVLLNCTSNTIAAATDARYVGLIAFTEAHFKNIKAWKPILPA